MCNQTEPLTSASKPRPRGLRAQVPRCVFGVTSAQYVVYPTQRRRNQRVPNGARKQNNRMPDLCGCGSGLDGTPGMTVNSPF